MRRLLLAGLMALCAQSAFAQTNVARFGAERSRVYGSFGVDPALISTLGFAQVASIFGRDVQFSADAGVAGADLDVKDFRARITTQASLLRYRSLHLTGSATAIARGTDNVNYRAINFGADISGTIGVYRPGWFVGGEFGKDKAVVTHIEHSQWYRDHFFPDAKDGWYLNAGGTLHYGAVAGVAFRGVELGARAGLQQTENYRKVSPPAYANVSIAVGL